MLLIELWECAVIVVYLYRRHRVEMSVCGSELSEVEMRVEVSE